LEQLGWVKPGKRPRMIAVQASGCAPVVRAFDAGDRVCEMWQNASTFAAGLRVPKPYGDAVMLDILRASNGIALALTDEEILTSILDWARNEGLLLSPEGASVTAAYDKLLASGELKPSDRVVLFNTGAGLKYADVIAEAMHLVRPVSELQPA
jgi:threonine synthase